MSITQKAIVLVLHR